MVRRDGHEDFGPLRQVAGELAQISHPFVAGKTVLPGLVGDFEQDDLVLATGNDVREHFFQMLDAVAFVRHELRVGKDGDLRAQAVAVIGQVDEFRQLLPIVGPGVHALAAAAGEGNGSNLQTVPGGIPAHHREHAVVVEPLCGKEFEIAFESRAVVFTAPQRGKVRDPQSEKRASVVDQGMSVELHPSGTLCGGF